MISYYIFFQFKKFISIGLCVFRNIFHKNILSTSAEMGISDYCFFDVDPNIFYDIIKSYKFSSWKKNFKINIEHIAICFYAPGSRKGGCYYSYMVLQHKKSVGVEPLLVPHSEAFALPDIVERATQKPTPICTDTPFHRVPVRALRTQNPVKRMRIYTSRRHLPLPCP